MDIGVSHTIRAGTSFLNGRKIEGIGHVIEFYVSPKNFDFFSNYVVPHIAIVRKREKIESYIKMRKEKSARNI
ncbi:MAG: hypothetical protein CMH61_01255 [Nanoarchaeota archaeon]|nr:hypothetical protein [Nanoarchaeota archaeon]|tara:strand:+ start:1709 stop:1927 length:219 start_codon:yes stop_codon:yes gene_type:complete